MLPPKQISPSRKYNSGSLPSSAPSQKSNKNGSPNMMLVSGEPANDNYHMQQTESRPVMSHQRTHSHDLAPNSREEQNVNRKPEEHSVGHCRTRSNPIVQSFSTVKQTFKNLHRPSSASATGNQTSTSPPASITNQIADSRRSSVSTCKIKNPGVRLLYTLGRKGKGDGCLTRNDLSTRRLKKLHATLFFTTKIQVLTCRNRPKLAHN